MQLSCLHWCSILRCWKLWWRKTKILLRTLQKYTSDIFILDIIKNELKLDFTEIPFQHRCNSFPLSTEEMSIINSEIQKLKSKKVIVNRDKGIGDYISGVFTRSTKNGSHRMILNLKTLTNLYATGSSRWSQIQNVLNVI